VTIGFWHEYSRILQRNSLYTLRPNHNGDCYTFLAAALCGTAAPLNPKYKQEEFNFYYEDTQAKALIMLSEGPEAAIAAVTPDMILINAKVNTDGTLSFELVKTGSEPAESSNPAAPNADSGDDSPY
ncbi:MAG: hypothetical protein V7K19_12475, partial [Nostoc sp.]